MAKYYIQFKYPDCDIETVDEFDTRSEARKMLTEYLMVGGGTYYISTRCCKAWKENV